jgi:hypothetical protein
VREHEVERGAAAVGDDDVEHRRERVQRGQPGEHLVPEKWLLRDVRNEAGKEDDERAHDGEAGGRERGLPAVEQPRERTRARRGEGLDGGVALGGGGRRRHPRDNTARSVTAVTTG